MASHGGKGKKKGNSNYEQWSAMETKELIRLLVDEVKNGNRLENGKFRNEVFIENVLPKLNRKYNSKKTLTNVKNKLRVLKQRLEPVKALMESNARFGWDGHAQKITAPEEVWVEYFQAHPDAVDYRHKFVEDYDDLMLIFTDATPIGAREASLSSGDADHVGRALAKKSYDDGDTLPLFTSDSTQVDDASSHELPLPETEPTSCRRKANDMASHGGKGRRRGKAKAGYEQWSAMETKELIRLLVDEVNRGNRLENGTFKTKVIDENILPKLNRKFNSQKTVTHVKNKLKILKQRFQPVKALMLSNSRFKWDRHAQKITAPEEVWDEYFQANPDAVDYRHEFVEDYDDLNLIFINATTIGAGATTLSSRGLDYVGRASASNLHIDGDTSPPQVGESSSYERPAPDTEPPLSRQRANDYSTSDIRDVIGLIGANFPLLIESFQITRNWYEAVEEIPNLTSELKYFAYEYLNNATLKEAFVRMPPIERRKWLEYKHRRRRDD